MMACIEISLFLYRKFPQYRVITQKNLTTIQPTNTPARCAGIRKKVEGRAAPARVAFAHVCARARVVLNSSICTPRCRPQSPQTRPWRLAPPLAKPSDVAGVSLVMAADADALDAADRHYHGQVQARRGCGAVVALRIDWRRELATEQELASGR